jgi:hypothetical protein
MLEAIAAPTKAAAADAAAAAAAAARRRASENTAAAAPPHRTGRELAGEYLERSYLQHPYESDDPNHLYSDSPSQGTTDKGGQKGRARPLPSNRTLKSRPGDSRARSQIEDT